MEQINEHIKTFDAELSKVPLLVTLEKHSKVPKVYLVMGSLAVMLVLTFFNFAGSLVSSVLGFLYPAYASFRALKTVDKSDDTLWLTYWVVFAFFGLVEHWSDMLLSWFPFYYFLKSLCLLWLYLPATRGALTVYSMAVEPLFERFDAQTMRMRSDFMAKREKASGVAKAVSEQMAKAKTSLNEDLKKAD